MLAGLSETLWAGRRESEDAGPGPVNAADVGGLLVPSHVAKQHLQLGLGGARLHILQTDGCVWGFACAIERHVANRFHFWLRASHNDSFSLGLLPNAVSAVMEEMLLFSSCAFPTSCHSFRRVFLSFSKSLCPTTPGGGSLTQICLPF